MYLLIMLLSKMLCLKTAVRKLLSENCCPKTAVGKLLSEKLPSDTLVFRSKGSRILTRSRL